ncbi:MAG TPA: alpha/beta hydrolase [Rubrobacter sp.]|nr:alpha/beta hydrolase [Rubrobacter sp.]
MGKGNTMHETNDVEFATTSVATDVTLHYAERGDREGKAIIFLHGYSDSWYSFSRVLPLLSPSYHAFALTQRGHGDSDKPECCYTPHDFATDVDAFMDALGIDIATIVGASTGAVFAQRVALSYPRRVCRLVLIAPQTPAHENEALSGLREEVRTLEDPVPPEFVREFQEGTIHHPVPQEFLETAISESLKLPAHVWRDYLDQAVLSIDRDYVVELGEIDVPTLILWGERDPLFPREEQERLAAAIPGATLKVSTLKVATRRTGNDRSGLYGILKRL